MTTKRLEELARNAERWASEGGNKDFRDLARCAREYVLMRQVAVRAYILLARLKEQNPKPPESIAVRMARKNLKAAIEAVEAADVT